MKQYIKKVCLIPMILCLSLFFYTPFPLHAGFDMGGLSEDDVMAMQQALENEINNMSPAERDNFYQIMENVERMSQEDPAMLERFITGQMSKDEEAQFVNTMVPETMAQQPTIAEIPSAESATEPAQKEQKAEVKELSDIELSTQETISSIIAKTESFLVKMQSYPEINTKIRSWSKKNGVTSWPSNKQWKDVEFDINFFIQKLFIIEHEKNSTKKKAFLDAVVKDSSLSASLTTLNNMLLNYEKAVDIAPFGITKIKKETKNAMQKVINTFTYELYNNTLSASLDEVLKVYEAEDKKLKEEGAELTKKAQQESLKARPKEYMKSAGQEKEKSSSRGSSRYSSGYDDYDYSDYGDYGSNYSSYPSSSYRSSSPSSYSSSSRTPSSSGGGSSSPRGTQGTQGARQPASASFDGEESNEKPGTRTPGSPSQATGPSATKKVQAEKQRSAFKRKDDKEKAIENIGKYLDKAIELIAKKESTKELNDLFKDLASTLKKEFTVEELAQLNEKLSRTVRYLTGPSKSVRDSLKSLTIKLNKEAKEVKDEYKNQVKEIYNEYKGILDKYLDQMQVIENSWDTLSKAISKKNMYTLWDNSLAIDDEKENVDKEKKPLPTSIVGAKENLFEEKGLPIPEEKPTTLVTLKDAIKDVITAIKEFIK